MTRVNLSNERTGSETARPGWVADAVFYQIFADRFARSGENEGCRELAEWGEAPTRENFFGGDLAGIEGKLPYLADLGVTAVYLTPIFKASTNHRYDAHDYLEIDPMLGNADSLRSLVGAAHEVGVRIVLDCVFNHCGDGFWAFRDLMEKGEDSQYRDWFMPRALPIVQDPPNYQTCGGARYLPKLNGEHREVRDYLIRVATHWIRAADIDGWRLDVPWKMSRDFWSEFRAAVKSAKPDAYIVGEIWRDAMPWLDLYDGAMNYRLRDVHLDYCVRDHMDAEDAAFETIGLIDGSGSSAASQLNLLGSHDTARLLTLCKGDAARVVLAMTAMFTSPGAPMIYYGDEIGLEGENDPGCRRCMPWNESEWNPTIATAVRSLIAIRQAHPALRSGTWEPLLVFNGVLAYRRRFHHDEVIVVLNPRNAQFDLKITIDACSNSVWRDLLGGGDYSVQGGALTIDRLAEKSALVLVPGIRT